MNKFEALKSLGYNYISRDEKNFYGNETIRAWVYKPSGMLYNDYIEKKYGEGTGLCNGVPKGCDRAACLCFIERKKSEEE